MNYIANNLFYLNNKINLGIKDLEIYCFNLKKIKIKTLLRNKEYLSSEIINNIYKYKSKEKLKEYLASNFFRRLIISSKLNCIPAKIKFGLHNGKPYLLSKNLYFNITHSNDYLIIAFYKKNIGIDLQKHTKKSNILNIAKRYFLKSEFNQLKKLKNLKKQQNLFYWLWAYKEATIKLYADYLISGLNKYSFICNNSNYLLTPLSFKDPVYYTSIINQNYFLCIAVLT